MMILNKVLRVSCLAFLTAILTFSANAQQKRALTPDDYGQFETLGTARLSPDGAWLAYEIRRVNEENELRLRSLTEDSVRVIAWATGADFSPDGRWLVWRQEKSLSDKKNLEKAGKPVWTGAGILDLETGEERKFEDVSGFAFDAMGRFLAIHDYMPDAPKRKGSNIRVLDLRAGTETTFGSVSEFSWSDEGSLLAFVIDTGTDAGNGVQLFDAASGRVRGLVASNATYQKLLWRKDSNDLAVLHSLDAASEDGTAQTAMVWKGLNSAAETRMELDPSKGGVADGYEVVEHSRLAWSKDGRSLAIGLRPVEDENMSGDDDSEGDSDRDSDGDSDRDCDGDEGEDPDSSKTTPANIEKKIDDADLPGFELWHTSDVRIVPTQKERKAFDDRAVLLAVWQIEKGSVIPVGTDLQGNASLVEGWKYGLEQLDTAYPWGAMFGRPYRDVWKVDLGTGERTLLLEKVRYSWSSPAGVWDLMFDGKDYWTINLESNARHNISASLPSVFADTTYDTPTDLLPPHGVGGWLEGDEAVLLYDEYDIWKVNPDGSGGEKLTSGEADKIEYRIARIPDDDVPGLSPEEPIFASMRGVRSKQQGYARLRLAGSAETLIFADKRITGLMKADSTDTFVFRQESFSDSPDLFTAGVDLGNARQVTETNPFMSQFAWSQSELIDFVSETGRPLQAALHYPVGYKKGDHVPMIVYTYEIVSTQLHSFRVPSETDYYNFTAWTHEGYAVLLPDIVYTAREPGPSALASVRAAVAKVVEMGIADPERVGLIGHSWGGYQATYLPTRTNIFAASVAGAPLTDFVSFMGQIHWQGGSAELGHWETGQARMEVPFWEDPEAHRRSSPIHKIQDLETPMLMVFGDDDGTVDYDQGTEFYNFARRAGKEMVLLVYQGERHGYRKKPNQVDYHRRILEWFGHFLKGEPAEKWITEGIPVADQKAEGRRVATQSQTESK